MKKINDDFTKNEILELAGEFKKRRLYLGLSQLKFSKLANMSQSIINKLENGKIDPTFSTILKIEKTLENQENISNLKARNIMIKNIITISLDSTVFECLTLMRENDFSQLIVMEKEVIKGTIYEKTILDIITKKVDIYSETIKRYLEPSPIIVPIDYSVSELSFIFQNKKTKFVVVGDENKILGIITKSDLFKG